MSTVRRYTFAIAWLPSLLLVFSSFAIPFPSAAQPFELANLGARRFIIRTPDGLEQLALVPNQFGGFRGEALRGSRVLGGGVVADHLTVYLISRRGNPLVVRISQRTGAVVVRRVSKLTAAAGECSAHQPAEARIAGGYPNPLPAVVSGSAASFSVTSLARASAPLRVVQVGVYADAEWSAASSSEQRAELVSILSVVDALYRKQLRLTLAPRFVPQLDDALTQITSRSADVILTEFQEIVNNAGLQGGATVHHLFSGKRFFGSVSGLAYRGVACAEGNTYSYGITQRSSLGVQWVLLAHELGHNLGAGHSALGDGIMSPSVQSGLTQFSDGSVREISSYLAESGGCLVPQSPGISIAINERRLQRGRLVLQLRGAAAQDSSCRIELYGATTQSALSPSSLLNTPGALLRSGVVLATVAKSSRVTIMPPVRRGRYYVRAAALCSAARTLSGESAPASYSAILRLSFR